MAAEREINFALWVAGWVPWPLKAAAYVFVGRMVLAWVGL